MTSAVLLSWSGGKDSLLALLALEAAGERVQALITTITAVYDRVSMHGVRRVLVEQQAQALRLPLVTVTLPVEATNAVYEARWAEALIPWRQRGLRRVAFGDLFLADVRAYRETLMARLGLEPVFPIWGRDTAEAARTFVRDGYRAVVTCVDGEVLDRSWAGRAFDAALLAALPPGVDPCGERGEFHTFVTAGPRLGPGVRVERGAVVTRGRWHFADLLPAGAAAVSEPPASAAPVESGELPETAVRVEVRT